ncbi:MAG: family 10 glycosylhydrolase, partial [Chloroflexi bacterium]|nr:family 10 glycosylhydrolase [Chloroflexota bacterium]
MSFFQRALVVLVCGGSLIAASPAANATPSSASEVSPTPAASSAARHGLSEARAMWVVRYSLLSPEQVHAVVERAYRYHFNALMVQVRGRGDAYYGSSIEPRAEGLLSQPADFDPLAQMIREAHLHGIKVFAWFDSMLVWTGSRRPRSPRHVVNLHPEWIDARYDGYAMSGTDYEGQFLNPGIPAVRQYTVRVCEDLVRQYDVDGIHLDYIRYPSPTLGYNGDCLAAFYSSMHPNDGPQPDWKLHEETRLHPHEW